MMAADAGSPGDVHGLQHGRGGRGGVRHPVGEHSHGGQRGAEGDAGLHGVQRLPRPELVQHLLLPGVGGHLRVSCSNPLVLF